MRYVTIAYCIVLNFTTMCLDQRPTQLKLCLKKIAEDYFMDNVVLIIYWTEERQLRQSGRPKRLQGGSGRPNFIASIVQTLSKSERLTVRLREGDHPKRIFNLKDKINTDNVIIILNRNVASDPDALREKLKASKNNAYWGSQSRLIVIMRAIPTEPTSNLAKSIVETLWTLIKAANVLVVISDENGLSFFKWYPYTKDCTDVKHVQIVDEWRDGDFVKHYPLFSQIEMNLNGCELTAGTIPCPPYVLEPDEPNRYVEGLDIRLLNSLADFYNFKVKYISLPDGVSPYIIFQDGKPSGYHKMLYEQELDLMLFGIRINFLRNQIADPLDSYTEDALVWVVPTPTPTPQWKSIVDAFSAECWVLIMIFFILLTGTWFLIDHVGNDMDRRHFQTFSSCLLTSIGVILNEAVPHPNTLLLRLFMFMFSFFAINLTAAYQSSLITLLTNRRHSKMYESPMDAVKDGVVTYLFPSGLHSYNQSDFDLWNQIFQPGQHVFSENYVSVLRKIATDKSAMILMTENIARFEMNSKFTTENKEPQILILKEKFSQYQVTIYMSKGHPLKERFRRKVNQMVEGGITGHWLAEIFSFSRREIMHEDYEIHKSLTIYHLEGAFFVLIGLLFVSLLVFCGEIVLDKVKSGGRLEIKKEKC